MCELGGWRQAVERDEMEWGARRAADVVFGWRGWATHRGLGAAELEEAGIERERTMSLLAMGLLPQDEREAAPVHHIGT